MFDPLERRRLGRRGPLVTRLGFGGGPLGEQHVRIDNRTADDVLEAAIRAGISYYDTAPKYGLGKSEHRVGRVLGTHQRDRFTVSSKVGFLLPPLRRGEPFDPDAWGGALRFGFRADFTYDGVMRAYEDSLQRLGLSYIDVLVIHDIEAFGEQELHLDQLGRGGGFRALERLRDSGDIAAIGGGVNARGTIPDIVSRFDIDFFLVAMPYTLLDQSILDDEFELIETHDLSIVIGAVYSSGILATGVRSGAAGEYAYTQAPESMISKVGQIESICDAHKIPLQAAALQFPLAHPRVVSVIPGAAHPSQVVANVEYLRTPIPGAFWEELRHERLLHGRAPVPA
jgi:D-threo-aldose 1-dehydrogenase